jgi:hypothetical protein
MPQSAAERKQVLAEDAEHIILGTCIIESSADPLTDLDPQQFYSRNHQQIARAILSLKEAGKPIDYMQLSSLLEEWKSSVLASEVTALTDGIPFGLKSESLVWYKSEIKRLWQERQTRKELYEVGEAAAAGAPVEDLQRRTAEISERAKPTATSKPAAAAATNACPHIPEGAWHPVAREYRDVIGPTTEASHNFHLACFLTMMGAALQRYVCFNMSELLYPNLFTALVGTSGASRKGTAMAKGAKLLKGVGVPTEFIRSIDSAESFVRALAAIQGETLKEYIPAVARLSELRSLFDKANKKGLEGIVPKLNEAYDGDPLELKTGDKAKVENPNFSIITGTSMAYTQKINRADLEGGLGNRFCFVPGEKRALIPIPPRVAEPQYTNLCARISAVVEFWKSKGNTEFSFDTAAENLWIDFYKKQLPSWAANDDLLESMTERYHHHAAKVSMIYAALDQVSTMSMRHLGPALLYVRFLFDGLLYSFQSFGVSNWVLDEKKIIETVRMAMPLGIRQRTLQQKFWRIGSEHFQRHLKSLCGGPGSEESNLKIDKRGRQYWVTVNDG